MKENITEKSYSKKAFDVEADKQKISQSIIETDKIQTPKKSKSLVYINLSAIFLAVLTFIIWKVSDEKSPLNTKTLAGHYLPVNSIAFSPDGKLIVSGSFDNTIKIWSMSE